MLSLWSISFKNLINHCYVLRLYTKHRNASHVNVSSSDTGWVDGAGDRMGSSVVYVFWLTV